MMLFIWAWVVFSDLFFGGSVVRLANDDFAIRQLASADLRQGGRLAYPTILRGLQSDNAEVRSRCERLSGRAIDDVESMEAWLILLGYEPNYSELVQDKRLRSKLMRLAEKMEMNRTVYRYGPDAEDDYGNPVYYLEYPEATAQNLKWAVHYMRRQARSNEKD